MSKHSLFFKLKLQYYNKKLILKNILLYSSRKAISKYVQIFLKMLKSDKDFQN